MKTILLKPLTKVGFAIFGDVIEYPIADSGDDANQGRAKRVNFLTRTHNLRSSPQEWNPPASENVCLFRTTPSSLPFEIKLLERHAFSTQMFVPMIPPVTSETRTVPKYLVMVALNDPSTDTPDWSTLSCFIANSNQAFNYKPGIWHHPMVGLYDTIDFVCIVYERREHSTSSTEDTEESYVPSQSKLFVDLQTQE